MRLSICDVRETHLPLIPSYFFGLCHLAVILSLCRGRATSAEEKPSLKRKLFSVAGRCNMLFFSLRGATGAPLSGRLKCEVKGTSLMALSVDHRIPARFDTCFNATETKGM